jgi:hypothetical protein
MTILLIDLLLRSFTLFRVSSLFFFIAICWRSRTSQAAFLSTLRGRLFLYTSRFRDEHTGYHGRAR